MHFYTLTIMEETESEYKSELKLWENTDGNIWLQIGYDDNDPITTQGIPLTPNDARALISELSRILEGIEGNQQRILGELLKQSDKGQGMRTDLVPGGNEVKQKETLSDVGLTRKQSHTFQQIADIPEETSAPSHGKQLSISKVNWGGK
jgi:hypothetical protein